MKKYTDAEIMAMDGAHEEIAMPGRTLNTLKVAGACYHGPTCKKVKTGEEVFLIAEPENTHSADAIAIVSKHGMLGYVQHNMNKNIPREHLPLRAQVLDRYFGGELSVKLCKGVFREFTSGAAVEAVYTKVLDKFEAPLVSVVTAQKSAPNKSWWQRLWS